jgi:hypothetical protein
MRPESSVGMLAGRLAVGKKMKGAKVRLAQAKSLWPGRYLEFLKITLVALKINVFLNPAMNGWPLPSAFQSARRITKSNCC